ncbi:DUF4190 domain-containing protein [Streptomyces sp. NPDC096176]|uniref:DUF4190 domain-containing protein n=1 Tax=Streptomyces sp. NPDC096176 TaxID=3366079 RepID=UPI003808C03F
MSIPPPPPSAGPYSQPGPYGPGQPGPYGAPQGWYPPPPRKMSALAIVAFVLSLVFPFPLLPLILGIVALSQIRRNGEKGKGFAVAAISIHGATLALWALIVGLGVSGAFDDGPPAKRDSGGQVTSPGSEQVQDIRKGDCFNTNDKLEEYESEGGEAAFSVSIVPCGEPHEAEAYAVFDLEDGPYPGADEVVSIAEEKCAGTLLTDYVGDNPKLAESLEVYYYHPQSSGWAFGDREVTCFLGDASGSSTGSVRATGSGS